MKKKLKVGVDCDDVLFKCNEYSLQWLKKEIPDADCRIEDIKNWTENGPVLNARMKYFRNPDFIRTMPLYEGAQEFIRSLLEVADVYFVTSVNIECLTSRAEALAEYFPEVPSSNYIFATAKGMVEMDLLLDDAPHNILSAEKVDVPVLFRRPWNSHLSGLPAVDSYAGFLHIVDHVRNAYTAVPPKFEGGIICVVGLPGSGKTQIIDGMVKEFGAKKIISYTTRSGYKNSPYHCICSEDFAAMKKEFAQTSVYGGDSYGITRSEITDILNANRLGVVAVDICGAISIKAQFPNQTAILFANGSRDAAIADIIDDDSLTTAQKVFRINGVSAEEKNAQFADYIVTTDYKDAVNNILIRR